LDQHNRLGSIILSVLILVPGKLKVFDSKLSALILSGFTFAIARALPLGD
jgi:hypothetical protein